MFVKDILSLLHTHYYGAVSPRTNNTGRYHIDIYLLSPSTPLSTETLMSSLTLRQIIYGLLTIPLTLVWCQTDPLQISSLIGPAPTILRSHWSRASE